MPRGTMVPLELLRVRVKSPGFDPLATCLDNPLGVLILC